jgi:hypothetical protein
MQRSLLHTRAERYLKEGEKAVRVITERLLCSAKPEPRSVTQWHRTLMVDGPRHL